MTITEAHATVTLLRFANGTSAESPDGIRDAAAYLAERAGKALDLTLHLDPHDLDAAIHRAARRTERSDP